MPAHPVSAPPPPRRTGALGRRDARRVIDGLPAGAIAQKYQVLDAICAARARLGLKDGAVAVLRALVSFHPADILRADEPPVVHPSNRLLQARANGMAEATLRRHLANLVAAGIVLRRDSPNGKRYVREGGEGRETYGFDLSLLVARAAEFDALKEEVEAEARERRRLLDLVTVHRRELRETLAEAFARNLTGDWTSVAERFRDLSGERAARLAEPDLRALVAALAALGDAIDALLRAGSRDKNADAAQYERRYPESNPQPTDSELVFHGRRGSTAASPPAVAASGDGIGTPDGKQGKPLPLGVVLAAFPAIADYGRGGAVGRPDELAAAAEVARGALGISASAWSDAVSAMGRYEAAVAVAFILDHHETIRSPGGYLRALTDRAGEGSFSAWALVLSTARRRASATLPLRKPRS